MKLLPLLLIIPFCISCGSNEAGKKANTDQIRIDTATDMYYVPAEDPSMNAAIIKAKSTIDEFDQALMSNNTSYSDFAIKKRYNAPEGGEHMWIGVIKMEDGGYRGVVNNDAESTKEVKFGDTVLVRKEEITDWMYLDNNVLKGGYTIREIRNKMKKEERKKFDEELGFIIKE